MSSGEEFVFEDNDVEEEDSSSVRNGNGDDGISEEDFITSDGESDNDGNETYQPEESEAEESTQQQQTPRRRRTRSATRQCSTKTYEKMSQVIREEGMTEKEALGDVVQDADVEYLHDTPSEEDDNDGGNGNAKKESSLKARKRKRHKRVLDSEDEDDQEASDQGKGSEGYHRKQKRVRRSLENEFDEDARNRGKERGERPTYFQATYSSHHHSPYSQVETVKCPSIKDERTNEDLPKTKPHVCHVACDGTRHCYTLDSLYRVAIDENHKTGNDLQFLQPPEFTSAPMDDDLMDQIASRFGRQALNIEQSRVYKEMQQRRRRMGSQGAMGSTDFYCCPLCYIEASRRHGNLANRAAADDDDDSGAESAGRGEDSEDPFSFQDDPMTILCNVGLKTASTFCFEKLPGVKKHVEVVHDEDLAEMKGNDLFKRFQIRASDGLLQHWLNEIRWRNMWAYWASDGHSNRESFSQLANLIGKLEGKKQPGEYGSSFSKSFPNRARKLWSKLSYPYSKPECDDTDGTIDDSSVEEDFKPQPVIGDQETDPEGRMIEHLRKKNEERGNGDTSDEVDGCSRSGSSSDDSVVESEEEEVAAEEEEEEVESVDSWMRAKTQKPTAARRRKSRSNSEDSDDSSLFESNQTSYHAHGKITDSDDETPTASNFVSP